MSSEAKGKDTLTIYSQGKLSTGGLSPIPKKEGKKLPSCILEKRENDLEEKM